jgi:acetyl esterase
MADQLGRQIDSLLYRSLVIAGGWIALVSFAAGAEEAKERSASARLQEWLAKFPEADADGDGVLTETEAKAFRKQGKRVSKREGQAVEPTVPQPTRQAVAYGPHPRNVLDFWQVKTATPSPVFIFFHGGSFKAGYKSAVVKRPIFRECLAAGINVVSVNYRYSSDAPYPAPMFDGGRAVQFVRSQAAAWNVDPERIAVGGSSAGATLGLWVALHEDLADPDHPDPVNRYSSRVQAASCHSGTAGLWPEYFRQQAGVTQFGAALWQLFGVRSQAEFDAPGLRGLQREASPLTHASAGDPPLFLVYAGDPAEAPFTAKAPQRDWIHHVCLGLPLRDRYEELRLPCQLYDHRTPPPAEAEIDFLKSWLLVR